MTCRERQHRRNWKEQQDQILKEIVGDPNQKKMKWNQVAEQLSLRLNLQLPRTSKQCRQRWMNIKTIQIQSDNPWTVQQDLKLIRACKEYGHRWAKLAIEIGEGRNDNSLKNHFYSTLRRAIRWITKFLKDQKKNFQQMKKSGENIENQNIYEQFCKIRNFQSKNFTKVFSMIDSKQQSRFQSTKDFEYRELQDLNEEILYFMELFVQQKLSQIQSFKIILMIVKICRINRQIKTKYTKEVKLSILELDEIEKKRQEKKKLEKKSEKLVKDYMKETNAQIIPSKNKKQEILSEIEQKNLQKLKQKRQAYASRMKLPQIPEKSKSDDSNKNSFRFSDGKSKLSSFKYVQNNPLMRSSQFHQQRSDDHHHFSQSSNFLMSMADFRNKPASLSGQQIENNNPFKFSFGGNQGMFQFQSLDRSAKQVIEPQVFRSNPSYSSAQIQPQVEPKKESGLFSNIQTAENKVKLNLSGNFDVPEKNNPHNIYQSQNFVNVHWTPQQNNFAFPISLVNVPSPQPQNIPQPNQNMYFSRPLSNSFVYESQPYNMFESQPLILQRSLNYRESHNGSSNAMYHSFSYASSQENKSANSKKGI